MLRRLILGTAVCGMAATIVLCITFYAGSDESDSRPLAIGKVRKITDTSSLVLPLDAYMLTPAQLSAVGRKEGRLAEECMSRFGLDVDLTPDRDQGVAGRERNRYRYGKSSLREVKKWGYNPPPEWTPDVDDMKEPRFSAAELTVLEGEGRTSYGGQKIPDGGCNGEANRKLIRGGPPVKDLFIAEKIAFKYGELADKHPKVQAVFLDWSRCMQKQGFDYDHPFDPGSDPRFDTEKPSPVEISTAIADVECKHQVNLAGRWAAVEEAYQKLAIKEHARELARVRKALKAMLRNAGVGPAVGSR